MIHIIKEKENFKFRPSNWSERLAGNFASFKNRRLAYSPLVYPIRLNNQNAVVINDEFKEINPTGYVMLMIFADDNNLTIESKL